MKPASCPLASLTDGPLGPADTSPALECSQLIQPWPAPLPETPGSHNVVDHYSRTLPLLQGQLACPRRAGPQQMLYLPPHHHQ